MIVKSSEDLPETQSGDISSLVQGGCFFPSSMSQLIDPRALEITLYVGRSTLIALAEISR